MNPLAMSAAIASPTHTQRALYTRLSLFYFIYFSAIGVFVPYWTVYLQDEKGFSAAQIGELMAVFMLTKMIAPFLWGWISDRSNSRIGMIRWACFITIVCFALCYVSSGYWSMLLVIMAYSFFWNAALPQFEVLTLNHLESRASRYSQIRLWGSIGFIVMVVLLPFVIDTGGVARVLDVMLGLFIVLWLVTWWVPDKPQYSQESTHERLLDLVKQPTVWVLLLACTLQQASHGAYYTFFSIYLDDHGYSRLFTGWMWALGVIAEVLIFIVMYRMIQCYGAARLFIWAVWITAIRWFLLGAWVDSLPILVLSQLMHAATYGLFHASAIHLIHHYFPGHLQGRGQALYAGLSFGLGGALGGLLSGYAWDGLGNAVTFYICGGMAAIAGALSWYFVKEKSQRVSAQ